MVDMETQVLILGAGPGGYVCALRAAQLGLKVLLVEADKPGGTCLNVGCIPSKALIHAAEEFSLACAHAEDDNPLGIQSSAPSIDFTRTQRWKSGIVSRLTGGVSGLLKKAGVQVISGKARFKDGKTVLVDGLDGTKSIAAQKVVIATGSLPVALPSLPFNGTVISSTEALSLPKIPRSMVVVGGGYIGVELGTAYAKLGSQITIVEASEHLLPQYDEALSRPIVQRLQKLGVRVMTSARAMGLEPDSGDLQVQDSQGRVQSLSADKVLVTVGRHPRTEGWGREELALDMNGPFVAIDHQCQTSMRGIFAIGDVTGEPMLAHRAMAQGVLVAEVLAGQARDWDKTVVPAVCFSDPELVVAGLLPEQAKAEGVEIVVGEFGFNANGRAMTLSRDDGFVRVVARADNHLILGMQAVGIGVSELAAGFATTLEMQARLQDVADTVHAHPSLGEAIQEAALSALGSALHR